MNCKHDYIKSGFCEWTRNNGEIVSQIIKECKECGHSIESEINVK
jgi:hypothetical protein